MFQDPWLLRAKHSPLEFERLSFLETKNPIHVWRGYRIARDLMSAPQRPIALTLPDWILVYLDQIEEHVRDLFYRRDDGEKIDVAAELAAVTGFKQKGQGVRTDAFAADDRARRDIRFAIAVNRALREMGIDPDASTSQDVASAVTQVAENLNEAAADYRAAVAHDLEPTQDEQLDSQIRRRELRSVRRPGFI